MMRNTKKRGLKMKLLNIYLRFSLFVILIFFSTVFGLCAQYESVNSESQAKSYCKQGWNLLKEGKMEEAILNYKKAIELNPSNAEAYGDLGIIFEVKGQMKKAEEMYLKAIEAAPDYLNSYSNLALLYEKQADFAKAIFYWKKRLDLSDPEDPYTEMVRKRIENIARIYPEAPYKIREQYESPPKQITEPREENIEPTINAEAIEKVDAQIQAKAEELAGKTRETEQMKAVIQDLNNKLDKANQGFFTLKKENAQWQQKLVALQNDKAALEQEKGGLLKEINSLRETKAERQTSVKVKDLNAQLHSKTQEVYLKQQEIDQTEKELKNLKDTIERITQERLTLNKENEELKKKVASLEDNFKNANARLKTKENELKVEVQKTSETKEGLLNSDKELQEKLSLLKDSSKELKKLRKENADLATEIEKLKNSLPNLEQLETKVKDLSVRVKDAEQMKKNADELNNRLGSLNQEYAALMRENAELRQKVSTYKMSKEDLEKGFIAEITKLKKFNAELETKGKELYIKSLGAEEAKRNLGTSNKVVERINQGQIKLKKENEGLGQKIVSLENTLKSEKARLYDELGTAYTKAKLFDLAMRAYEESLTFNPNSAQVHYNLGLLYKHYLDNSKKAIFHLKKYLELNSHAPNKKEIEYLIDMLGKK